MQHRRPSMLLAATAALLVFATASSASPATMPAEAGDQVDIVLTEGDSRCVATGISVDAAPPARVSIDADRVDFDCKGATSFKFGSDAAFDFDDAKGTATAERVRIAATKFGITCTYEASTVTLEQDGTARDYAGGPIKARKVRGAFLCPGSVNLDSATIAFHQ
ncbi:hypothetical protein [Glycomyces rhizosphaerae]|uniref:Uncharacterized protein n=1 Tax=Glycomyces rhizosphaerae TaxID=2054422 RepID=A0ABV7PRI0_9ACTN